MLQVSWPVVCRASQVAFAVPGRLAWQTRPTARVLSVRTPPGVNRATANNHFGTRVVRPSSSNRRRRAPVRLRTRLPTDACARKVRGNRARNPRCPSLMRPSRVVTVGVARVSSPADSERADFGWPEVGRSESSAATSVCVIRGAGASHVNACVIDPRPRNPIVDAGAAGFERRPTSRHAKRRRTSEAAIAPGPAEAGHYRNKTTVTKASRSEIPSLPIRPRSLPPAPSPEPPDSSPCLRVQDFGRAGHTTP
jgi:hypothetical protein